jgi:TIR domain
MSDDGRKVFISYAHEDAALAAQIADTLASAGVHVWIDQQQMAPGDSFLERMNQGLGDVDYVLFLVSPASLASRWVSREWMSALAAHDGVVIPLRVAAVEMPPLLRDIIYIDFVAGIEAGLQKLVTFFKKEAAPPVTATRAAGALSSATRRELRLVAKRCLTELDFKECLWDLNIQESDVPGNTLQDRLLYLLQRMDSEGLIEDFIAWLEENRRGCVNHQLPLLRSSA